MSELTQQQVDEELRSQFADRSKILVRFFTQAERVPVPVVGPDGKEVLDGHGRQKFEFKWQDSEWLELRAPGQDKEIRRRPVREADKFSWPRHYEAFKKNIEQPLDGTPLEMIPFLSPAQVMEFKSAGFRTAENIINISDADGQRFMGFQNLKRKLQDFVQAAAGNAPLEKLRNDLDARDAEMNALKTQMAEQAEALKRLQAERRPKA